MKKVYAMIEFIFDSYVFNNFKSITKFLNIEFTQLSIRTKSIRNSPTTQQKRSVQQCIKLMKFNHDIDLTFFLPKLNLYKIWTRRRARMRGAPISVTVPQTPKRTNVTLNMRQKDLLVRNSLRRRDGCMTLCMLYMAVRMPSAVSTITLLKALKADGNVHNIMIQFMNIFMTSSNPNAWYYAECSGKMHLTDGNIRRTMEVTRWTHGNDMMDPWSDAP